MSHETQRLAQLESKVNNFFNQVENKLGIKVTNASSDKELEDKLLATFRELDQTNRDKVLSYAQGLVEDGKESMKKENAYLNFESTLRRAAMNGERVSFG